MAWLRSRFFKQLLVASLALPLLIIGFNSFDSVNEQLGLSKVLIKIDDVKIDAPHAQQALQYLAQGNAVNTDILRQQTWELLLVGASRLAFARSLNFWVSNEKVAQTLQNLPYLKDPVTNEFSDQRFAAYLKQRHFNRHDFVEEVRADLQRESITPLMSFTNLPAPVAETMGKLYGQYALEKRTIDYVVLRQEDAQKHIVTPDAATLETFYKNNSAQFMQPQRRTVQAIMVTPSTALTNVLPQQLNEAYQRNIAEYTTPAKRTVYQLSFKTAQEAEQAQPLLKGGAQLAQTLKTLKQDEKSTNLGHLQASQLPTEVAKTVFDLPVNTFSPPQPNPFGVAVYYVAREEAAKIKPLTEVEKELTTQLQAEQSRRATMHLIEAMQEDTAGGISLAELAQKHQQTIVTLTDIDAQGRDAQQKFVMPQALAHNTFLQRAFSVPSNNDVLSLDLPDQKTVFYHISHITPEQVPPLAQIQSKVVDAYKKQQARDYNNKQAQQMVQAMAQNAAWPTDAKTFGIKTTQRQRQEPDAVLSSDTLNSLFLTDAKKAVVGATNNGDVAVAMVTTIHAGDTQDKSAALGREVLRRVGQEAERAILTKRTKNVQLNRDAFDALMTP